MRACVPTAGSAESRSGAPWLAPRIQEAREFSNDRLGFLERPRTFQPYNLQSGQRRSTSRSISKEARFGAQPDTPLSLTCLHRVKGQPLVSPRLPDQ
jgi:hypothetical protein